MFAYTAGGAPNHVHYKTSDKFFSYAYRGVAFHGIAFANTAEKATLYQDVVMSVLEYRAKK